MKELSIFIDESGDFGSYEPHSPFYIITMVFHEQKHPIVEAIEKLDQELSYLGLEKLCIIRDLKKNYLKPLARKEWLS